MAHCSRCPHRRSQALPIARFALHHDKVIIFVVTVLALLGVRAYLTTPQSIFPAMSFSRIDVVAEVGDLPADQVRVAVTRPLEQAFQQLPSVTSVKSTSSQGAAELLVAFDSKTDPQTDLQYVDQAVSQARASVPAANKIIAVIVNPNSEPVLTYALVSPTLSQAVLRNLALYTLVPHLYGVRGMGRLLVVGGPATEYHVTLDPSALANAGIGSSEVAKALADANVVQAVGTTQRDYQRFSVLVDSSLHDLTALQNVMIPLKSGSVTPLSSLGTVQLGVSPLTDQSSYDAQHAVLLNVYALPGADTVAMAHDLKAKLAAAVGRLPRDVGVHLFWDQTTLIQASQSALRDAILLGALLAVAVIYLFLRSLRLTLVATAVIPLAMAIAIFALGQAHQTLNLMSMGGLAVAVGLIIDDAIVVIENIERHAREQPADPMRDTVTRAMSQLTAAMTASTAATVVVFLPLALLTGVTGFFFRALAFTLAASLVVSLLLALFLAPIVASALFRSRPHASETRRDPVERVLAHYDPLLRWTLTHRPVVYLGSAVVLVLTFVLLTRLPSDFLPKMDEGQFEIAYTLPPGTALPASDAAATQMERIVQADPAVAAVGRMTAIDSNGYSPTQLNQGLLRVRLKPLDERSGFEAVSVRLRDRLSAAVPSSLYDFHQILEDMINDLSGNPAPVEITIAGADQHVLISLAGKLADDIGKVPGVVDASNGVIYNEPSVRVALRGTRMAALGATVGGVGDALAALTQGTIATNVAGKQTLVPVRITVRSDPAADLTTSPVLANGATTSLENIAALSTVRQQSDINATNGQQVVRVTANIGGGATLSAVTAGIQRVLAATALPPGYTMQIGGQAATQRRSFTEFVGVIAVAVALVFAVMLATFRSYRLPFVILTTIPLALIGVALGLFVTGTPFNVSSFMGLLLLVGLVVKNGILLIDVANKQLAAGESVEDALVAAGKTRLRPIVMTTLAAIGGLFPLALGIGQGAEMEKPLAIAVIGGLSTATVFTLLVIPTLYAAFVGRKPPASIVGQRTAA